jgi:Apea-like HEPN
MRTTAARRSVFCCRLHYISINGNLGRGERLDDNFFVTNDRATIEALLPKDFEPSVGRMEYRSFKESPVVAYARLDELPPGSEQTRLLEHLLLLDAFENVFWLHADSCVGHELAFMYDINRGGIWSNLFEGLKSRSDSSQDTLTITANQFRELIRLYRILLKPTEVDQKNAVAFDDRGKTKPGLLAKVINSGKLRLAKIHTRTNSNRLTRALGLIGRSQKTVMSSEKIAFYCSALEALFSTSQFELSHQIAERVAVMTGGSNKSDRLPTYRFVKECYSFRSKYVHGAPLKAADELKLEAMSEKLDVLVRQCFHTILEDEGLLKAILSDADIDELMLSRLFE